MTDVAHFDVEVEHAVEVGGHLDEPDVVGVGVAHVRGHDGVEGGARQQRPPRSRKRVTRKPARAVF